MDNTYAAQQASVAQDAVEMINRKLRLEETKDSGTKLYHVLSALLEWSDVYGADFDSVLSEVRRDYAYSHERTDAQRVEADEPLCDGCGRLSSDCSADPCADVIEDREA